MTTQRQTFKAPLLMGILNCTPDSFFDGGRYQDVSAACSHALTMVRQGADIIDIGGESTRPGSKPIDADEQIRRTIPVIEKIRSLNGTIPISIDTQSAEVADIALAAGANIVNDVSGLRTDANMVNIVSKHNARIVIMHMQGTPLSMQENPLRQNVLSEVLKFLDRQINHALQGGLNPAQIIIDPGIGFGKTPEGNIVLLKNIQALKKLGYAVLVGASNKSILGKITGSGTEDRLAASVAVAIDAAKQGVDILRVHDVKAHADAFRVMDVLAGGNV